MRTAAKVFLAFLFLAALVMGGSVFAFGAGAPAQTINLPDAASGNAVVDDEDVPEVTARVGRISFIRGEAKILRAGSKEWETATLNLPIVEGDQIATDIGARVEIQFDNYTHTRLGENAALKVLKLKDEGIAVSISLGTLNVRVTQFDKDKSYFEIDAPKTTLALQKSGSYRVDAGKVGDTEVRVAAFDGGEARVYSDSAGFTLKNGRSSRIFIEGPTTGEWELADASRYLDEFDSWASDRDRVIAKRLKDAYYDKYYDNDIYGADDLNDHGEWVHTRNYGYVWRPHRASLRHYADWSPYRYGHWRWMPPYGWIWVNDEPWGWATYHHGRWFYDDGYWYWSPYGYYRPRRSWWFPALVVINIFNNNICWYPSGYYRRRHNYNWGYNNNHGGYGGNNNPPRPRPGPGPGPGGTGGGGVKPMPDRQPPIRVDIVPPVGVVAVPKDDFGTKTITGRRLTPEMAKAVLAETPDERKPILPVYEQINPKITREIKTERPKIETVALRTQVGAAQRKTDAPLDNELRTTRVFGGRPPVPIIADKGEVNTSGGGPSGVRSTGAVERPPVVERPKEERPIRQNPTFTPRENPRVDTPSPKESPRFEQPTERVKPREDTPSRQPPVRETPRNDPPPSKQPPVRETPRSDPPPSRQPPSREPPVKSEPKPESKPESKPRPTENSERKRDGR